MSKVAVVYWSGTGNTEAMANAVAVGAKAGGADVDVLGFGDLTADSVAGYDGLALGCPAMGAEQLEEGEVQPAWDDIQGALSGKKVVLFGSYGWGDGEWLRTWEEEAKAAGAEIAAESLAVNGMPDDDTVADCEALGKALA